MTDRGRFDVLTIAFHWLTLALFVPLVGSVLLLQSGSGLEAAVLLDVHRAAGATIFVMTATRLLWRRTFARLPPFPETMTRVRRAVVTASEYSLYALLLVQPLTGLAMTIARGRPFTLVLWQVPALIARDKQLAATLHELHEIGAYTLLTLIVLHATAALAHHFVLRDDVLSAMLPLVRRKAVQLVPSVGTLVGASKPAGSDTAKM